MRQKGFTLIELLAVIVILAIIALIATPMVLNTIDNARKGAAKSSALAYVNAIEQYMISSMLDSSKPQLQAGVRYQLSSTSYEVASIAVPEEVFINDLIELKGDKPESGYVTVTKEGTVDTIEMVMNNYPITCSGSSCEVVEEGEYEAYQVGDAVTIDGIGYHVTKTSSTINEYVTLLRDESIGDFAFDENGGTDFETSTLKTYLDTTYKATFGEKESYIKEITLLDFGEYDLADSLRDRNFTGSEGTYAYLYKNYRDVFFTVTRSNIVQHCDEFDICTNIYTYIVDLFWTKTSIPGNYGSTIIDGVFEYMDYDTNEHYAYDIWNNNPLGAKADNHCDEDGICTFIAKDDGVRPVVVISKKALD